MGIGQKIEEFLIGRMLTKGVIAGATAFSASKGWAWLAAHGVAVQLDPDLVASAITGAAAAVLNWWKNRKR